MLFSKELKHALPQHNVIIARSLEEARAQYDDSLPDITFLDIDLPDGNGFELLDYIRSQEPEAYVIMLTGSKLPEDVATSQEKGVSGYIIKPFTKAKIEEYIEDYMQVRERGIKTLLQETKKNRQEATAMVSPLKPVRD